MKEEVSSIEWNKTWSIVPLPPKRKVIRFKWVLNADGTVNKNKVCLVAKGFQQPHGFDFHETFSHVIKLVTIRLILMQALTNKWIIQQIDINSVFLNGILD
jgi:hypothetical protein